MSEPALRIALVYNNENGFNSENGQGCPQRGGGEGDAAPTPSKKKILCSPLDMPTVLKLFAEIRWGGGGDPPRLFGDMSHITFLKIWRLPSVLLFSLVCWCGVYQQQHKKKLFFSLWQAIYPSPLLMALPLRKELFLRLPLQDIWLIKKNLVILACWWGVPAQCICTSITVPQLQKGQK